uniref:COP9 signalosome complex subunit 6 n=1 Tax=Leptocylindrus danicus TaxID=163516 RepID=A0A7S2L474_9STRA|mmetsp:Transcript_30705/g.45037  ORF Transcript_30705/g.45037 Transcript_30705/m.45037 type:complete len:375 (+) Transcript_30705:173-1297(+)|eukprot:CAMPEP_0116011674 /NCGR_PEP_ID=MMETSP0321-20121206/4697_1 /TAXON_ID=163516 /ORGANISM="Leptocylindrus danicus var. danicus, Strain B650" /LENGTH=374 /DNA_ID=CAMNT_0003480929 /DNA_START=165 /DNA_END=1289 /DNA_ORIENTATION=+
MEIDSQTASSPAPMSMDETALSGLDHLEKNIQFHPLAIFAMSDHFTRVRLGGAPMPKDAPVIGLLFGQGGSSAMDNNNSSSSTPTTTSSLSIMDAEDVAYDPTASGAQQTLPKEKIEVKIELHRAVYPQQRVIGWYRVSEGEVSSDDMLVHKAMREFCQGDMIFVYMRQSMEQETTQSDGSDNDMEEEALPVYIYETIDGDSAFVALKFELNSRETERIAMEHVFKSREKKDTSGHLESIKSSVEHLNARVSIILRYLRAVQAGEVQPVNYDLLRKINSLLHQLSAAGYFATDGRLKQDSTNLFVDNQILGYLASLTKTIQQMQGYSEKSGVVMQLNMNAASDALPGREREMFMVDTRSSRLRGATAGSGSGGW